MICDNSESDEIKDLYEKIRIDYLNIQYKKNEKEKNFDINCLNALKNSNTKYIWVIGDGLILNKNKIKEVIKLIEKNYDFIVFDHFKRIEKDEIKEIYCNANEFFKDICWHVTLLGSTIFKKEFIQLALEKESEKYIGTFFMHLGILLESIAKKEFKGIVLKEEFLIKNPLKKSSTWSSLTFNTFCDGWIKFIELLPDIYNKDKDYVIKIHGIKSKLFTIKNLVSLRSKYDEYSIKNICSNKFNLKRVTNVPIIIIYLIWLIPKDFLRFLINILKVIKRRKNDE